MCWRVDWWGWGFKPHCWFTEKSDRRDKIWYSWFRQNLDQIFSTYYIHLFCTPYRCRNYSELEFSISMITYYSNTQIMFLVVFQKHMVRMIRYNLICKTRFNQFKNFSCCLKVGMRLGLYVVCSCTQKITTS